jgi:Mg/Co/Ni transporter MgtE
VRKTAELARYNLYVVDQGGRLVGALNLRELLLARSRTLLSDLMVRDPHRVQGKADRATVLTHPGWKEVHALPVVDADETYLGAIRYRTLRELEEELLAPRDRDMDTGAAFGQVIAAVAEGVLDALGGASGPRGGVDDDA